MEHFIEWHRDTEQEIMFKRNLSNVLSKPAAQRTTADLADLSKFFLRFDYFAKLQKEHGDKAFFAIMRIIKIKGVPEHVYLIEEG